MRSAPSLLFVLAASYAGAQEVSPEPTVSIKFKPPIGKKYRYTLSTLTPKAAAAGEKPTETPLINIMKIAGFKEGRYTVHIIRSVNGTETLFGTYRVSEDHDWQHLPSKAETAESRGFNSMTGRLGFFGIFGLSEQPLRVKNLVKKDFPFVDETITNMGIAQGDIEKIDFSGWGFMSSQVLEAGTNGTLLETQLSGEFKMQQKDDNTKGILAKIDAVTKIRMRTADGVPESVERKMLIDASGEGQTFKEEALLFMKLVS